MNYHELNPLIRARELELLSKEEFERMIHANSIEALGEILKTTVYHPYIHEGFEYDFEANLLKESGELFTWLKENAPEPEIVWIYTMRYTFHNLKVLTKAEMTGENLDHLYRNDGFYSLETLKQAIHTQQSTELAPQLLESIKEVHEYCEESAILQGIDVIYDRYFLTEQRRLGEKLGSPELLEEIIAFIDLTNITTMARGIIQQRSKGFMSTVLSSSGTIPKEAFLDFVKSDEETYLNFLQTTDYRQFLAPAIQDGKLNFIKLEQMKDDYLTSLYQAAQTQAFGPLPLLAFLNAKEVEMKNLRLLIIGKRNHFDQETIRERVRQVYDA
ncbi:V-type sodium ATPase subunit C [Enterococcus sp. 10A9_DIV0425]|uniref:V-type sodium ATPase subunit C n=1 Tax=Candidatus Enterococcus wittei TaxID=1987383 RepID=A0A242JXJ4_9ENTE|nr:V-type ATPase subunit [Enterococcus sp. 10A9_DIV0425]OTP10036.1 V-type sodium ATPase subunit C [Enterococcus sp. 10A9_DIV0425]THE13874.1 V-type ATP synthase subunit C [Enterococcus hirae]